jgi:hypothetical protein
MLYDIALLLRRQLRPAAAVLVLAGAITYGILTASPVYAENGSIVFAMTRHMANLPRSVSELAAMNQSLIATEATMAEDASSPSARADLRAAGGTAQFTVTPFNSYNLEYPDYAVPSATLSVSSGSPAVTHRTFQLVFMLIARRLAAAQAHARIPRMRRVKVYVAADTKPQHAKGSRIREIAGMGVITAIAVIVVTRRFDRRRTSERKRRGAHARPRARGA